MPPSAVVIAATELLPGVVSRAGLDGEALRFTDTEPLQALQAITQHRPPLIILERIFAASPRGAALINRIKSDASLAHAEVRVLSHSGDYVRVVARPSAPPPPPRPVPAPAGPAGGRSGATATASVEAPRPTAAAAAARPPLDWHGTRRAPRVRVRSGAELQLDGNPATIVDLSAVGAQVLCASVLRPNQKVRVALPNDDLVMRFRGSVAWARFELPRGQGTPRYRAGVEFTDADARALQAYCDRHRER